MNKEEERTSAPALTRPGKLQQVEETPESCTIMYHTPETDSIIYNMSASKANQELTAVQLTLSDLDGDGAAATIENSEGHALAVTDYYKLTNGLKESCKKLLDYSAGELTKQNSKNQSGAPLLTAYIDIKEYAALCGRDISTETKLKNFRKALNYDMETLYKMSVSIKDKRKGEINMRICQAYGHQNNTGKSGIYYFMFSSPFADYLIRRNLLLQLPKSLYLTGNTPLSFSLGRYLCDHYSMDSNQTNERYCVISVKAILNRFSTYFPDTESTERNRHSIRIKETVERALEELEDKRVITWVYCGAKKAPADAPATFYEFERLYIKYDVINAPDGTERRKRNAAKRKAAAERKRKAISRSKNSKAKKDTTTENNAPANGDQSGAQ